VGKKEAAVFTVKTHLNDDLDGRDSGGEMQGDKE
jgi:hypothetical protein